MGFTLIAGTFLLAVALVMVVMAILSLWPMPEELAARPWRCRLGFHRDLEIDMIGLVTRYHCRDCGRHFR